MTLAVKMMLNPDTNQQIVPNLPIYMIKNQNVSSVSCSLIILHIYIVYEITQSILSIWRGEEWISFVHQSFNLS